MQELIDMVMITDMLTMDPAVISVLTEHGVKFLDISQLGRHMLQLRRENPYYIG